ncbi:2-hydroxyacid dehydrogenase [Massilia forsythiae]|uniref:2-hydroxyacid dehydrogenase n=1 Tax=Massilia forsythiae TaxID=2728020 RepID=A0A7Z2VTX5_9BURK|nr:2-hydroxyacid dehydrogenase [Massilia forsythiae]QJD98941.1 2-hydroxyacid dehydrogenase [Massilia forsythiae]
MSAQASGQGGEDVVLLQLGEYTPDVQARLEAAFRCVKPADLERDPALAGRVRAIATRSNLALPAELVERLPALEIVATNGVGYDLIPLDLMARRGIVVTNTPDVLNAAVAELCVGALLALLRRLPQADRHVRSGAWAKGAFPLATGLAGKRLGIVGLGRIGKEIARRLEPFGVALSYYGRSDQRLDWHYEPDLEALARAADILVVAAPGGRETAGLIDARVLAALGPRGYLVNVARGSLVDEAALIAALEQGAIGGAALDVFHNEPDIDARLSGFDNVLLLPHIGSATHETRAAMAALMLENLEGWFRERKAVTPVTA